MRSHIALLFSAIWPMYERTSRLCALRSALCALRSERRGRFATERARECLPIASCGRRPRRSPAPAPASRSATGRARRERRRDLVCDELEPSGSRQSNPLTRTGRCSPSAARQLDVRFPERLRLCLHLHRAPRRDRLHSPRHCGGSPSPRSRHRGRSPSPRSRRCGRSPSPRSRYCGGSPRRARATAATRPRRVRAAAQPTTRSVT